MFRAIIILPFNVLITIPTIILYFTSLNIMEFNYINIISVLILSIIGFILMIWTMILFSKTGKGSPAPWNPIEKLIISGPYAYVRNPMISGVLITLFAIGIFFENPFIYIWGLLFLLTNIVYLPLLEEKELIKRYGDEYIKYMKNVPRLIPRLTAWKK